MGYPYSNMKHLWYFCYFLNSVCSLSFSASAYPLTEKGRQDKAGEPLMWQNKQKELEEWTSCPGENLPDFLQRLDSVCSSGGWHRLSTVENCEGSIAKEDSEAGLIS